MKEQNDILSKINRQEGLTVPPGYFEDFAARMAESLPERPELEHPEAVILQPPTLWTRVRPYVYMAAMFAGVWCMLKMFVLMTGVSDHDSAIDRNPILAEVIGSDNFISDFVINDINQWDLIDEMMEDGVDASSFDILPDSDTSDNDTGFIDPAAAYSNQDSL